MKKQIILGSFMLFLVAGAGRLFLKVTQPEPSKAYELAYEEKEEKMTQLDTSKDYELQGQKKEAVQPDTAEADELDYVKEESEPVIFTKKAFSRIVVLEDNELGRYLELEVELNIPEENEYFISAGMEEKIDKKSDDDKGNTFPKGPIYFATSQGLINPPNFLTPMIMSNDPIQLKKGIQTINLYFDGQKFLRDKINGPYEIRVYICQTGNEMKEGEGAMFITPAYQAAMFKL